MVENIHKGQSVFNLGGRLEDAKLVVILLHGRGATAGDMQPIAEILQMDGLSFLVPQAAFNRWYPNSAFGPLESNEPDLSSALDAIDSLVKDVQQKGFSDRQIVFGGFSQGGCLAAEYVARHARRYGGLFIFTGTLIGPAGTPRDYPGSLDGMPVFVAGSDVDPWVEQDFLEETAGVFQRMGAEVDFRIYPGMGHTVNQDEIDSVRVLLSNAKQMVEAKTE